MKKRTLAIAVLAAAARAYGGTFVTPGSDLPASDPTSTAYGAVRDGMYDLREAVYALSDHTTGQRNVMSYFGLIKLGPTGRYTPGETDATAAIQEAIDQVHREGGGEVYVPAGIWAITSIRLHEKVTIRGAGKGATVFRALPHMKGSTVDALGFDYQGRALFYVDHGGTTGTPPKYGVTLRDFTIDGNWMAQDIGNVPRLWGIYLWGVSHALISNVYVKDCLSHGITLKESIYGRVENVVVEGNGRSVDKGQLYSGDGICLLARSHDNIVINSLAIANSAIGFEDEGRQTDPPRPEDRNARNTWTNLTAIDNGDHNFLALFTDGAIWQNITSIGGNRNGLNVVGTTNSRFSGVRVSRPARHGIWIRPETYGAYGENRDVYVDATITDAAQMGVRIEDLQGGTIRAHVRGVGGDHAVSVLAATAAPEMPGSSDVTLEVDYDGSAGLTAAYGIYAESTTRLTIRDSLIKAAGVYGIWVPQASNLRVVDTTSMGSGNRCMVVDSLTGGGSIVANSIFAGCPNATSLTQFTVSSGNVVK